MVSYMAFECWRSCDDCVSSFVLLIYQTLKWMDKWLCQNVETLWNLTKDFCRYFYTIFGCELWLYFGLLWGILIIYWTRWTRMVFKTRSTRWYKRDTSSILVRHKFKFINLKLGEKGCWRYGKEDEQLMLINVPKSSSKKVPKTFQMGDPIDCNGKSDWKTTRWLILIIKKIISSHSQAELYRFGNKAPPPLSCDYKSKSSGSLRGNRGFEVQKKG